jgi:hypothetical protein
MHIWQGEQWMERANVVKEELTDKDTRFLAVYVEATNSCLVLLSEQEDKLGTMAIAVPKANQLLGLASSSILVGDRNVISARMFAEYVASKKNKIAMVSVYLDKFDEMQAQAFFMRLIEKVMQAENKKEPTAT